MKKTKNLVLFLLPASLILSHSFLSPSILLFFSCIPFPSPFFLLFHPLLHFTSPPPFLYLSFSCLRLLRSVPVCHCSPVCLRLLHSAPVCLKGSVHTDVPHTHRLISRWRHGHLDGNTAILMETPSSCCLMPVMQRSGRSHYSQGQTSPYGEKTLSFRLISDPNHWSPPPVYL